MTQLLNGASQAKPFAPHTENGAFVRSGSQFRNWVKADGSTDFIPEANRYHLYVSYACPWAHRTLIVRQLKKLQEIITVSVVHPHLGERGWAFSSDYPGSSVDPINGFRYLHEAYTQSDGSVAGRITVPVLWDKKRSLIVNNESEEIIRMFNSEFDAFADRSVDLYPVELRPTINEINAFIYDNVNNGVYKTGFATSQAVYETAFDALFDALDTLDARLTQQRYLLSEGITEADWRLFTTLVRFDAVYVGHFKCNLRRISDYPALSNYLKALYQQPGIAETVRFDHIKQHYYGSHRTINPSGIVPKGPAIDLRSSHDRAKLN
ncbi:MAG: glutathione S-transferase family protein [Gammaproteobacteria bacterium]|nr:glutathione S-transferase family protein [Gammaproteobacteria bacterium]